MRRLPLFDILGWLAILAWIAASLYFAYTGNAEIFSRFGAFGTAAAVTYFGLVRHSSGYPIGLHQKFHLVNLRLNDQDANLQDLYKTRTFMAADLKALYKKAGADVPVTAR